MTRAGRFFLVVIFAMTVPFMASAVDKQIGFSGFLTNNLGSAPISDGPHNIIFAIYTGPSGGIAVWTESRTGINTVTGEFSVMLGEISALTVNFSAETNYYLGISVDGNPEMVPRKKLLYVPYSFRTDKIETRAADPVAPETGQIWLIVP